MWLVSQFTFTNHFLKFPQYKVKTFSTKICTFLSVKEYFSDPSANATIFRLYCEFHFNLLFCLEENLPPCILDISKSPILFLEVPNHVIQDLLILADMDPYVLNFPNVCDNPLMNLFDRLEYRGLLFCIHNNQTF